MTYDQWKTTDPAEYYDAPDDEEERVEWDDMEMLSEDDDEFFAGWLDFQDTVYPEPCL